jgi:hypothetical protein
VEQGKILDMDPGRLISEYCLDSNIHCFVLRDQTLLEVRNQKLEVGIEKG